MIAMEREIATLAEQPTTERLAGLKSIVSRRDIQAVLKASGQANRHCRRLPRRFMVWFVICLGLFCRDCHRQVFRWLQPARRKPPGRSTFCEARKRLGVTPLRLLMERVVKLEAVEGEKSTAQAFYGGMRLMGVDSFVLDVPDTDSNSVFGKPKSGRAEGAFPQVRVLGLCELGTHIFFRVGIQPQWRSEVTMAKRLLHHLQENMLLLWDRSFFGYDTLRQVIGQGAHLLARIKKTLVFTPIQRLRDGSFLAQAYPSCYDRSIDRNGILVRIIEYTLNDPGRPGSGEKHRLLTTLLDDGEHPAKRLIELYHQRWEEELAIDELKTHQRERPVLRSETAAGVIQEIYGLLLAHYVVRRMMVDAGKRAQVSPLRLSFTTTIKILRCRLPELANVRWAERWYADVLAEIADEILPERRDRINPRVIRRKMSGWPKKRPHHRHNSQPTKTFREGILISC